jgi:hypothetical protein
MQNGKKEVFFAERIKVSNFYINRMESAIIIVVI